MHNTESKQNTFQKIREVIKQIPCGKVSTYGDIALRAGIKDARQTTWAIWNNDDPTLPCHRIVNKKGELAKTFGVEGWREQKRLLEEEGVEFLSEKVVDLDKHLWLEVL